MKYICDESKINNNNSSNNTKVKRARTQICAEKNVKKKKLLELHILFYIIVQKTPKKTKRIAEISQLSYFIVASPMEHQQYRIYAKENVVLQLGNRCHVTNQVDHSVTAMQKNT